MLTVGFHQARAIHPRRLGRIRWRGGLAFDGNPDGTPISPNSFSVMWGRAVPEATFHSLRHTHASALIAAGKDVVTVSRRLGHAKPTITLNVYGHLFRNTDADCADAIEKMLAN